MNVDHKELVAIERYISRLACSKSYSENMENGYLSYTKDNYTMVYNANNVIVSITNNETGEILTADTKRNLSKKNFNYCYLLSGYSNDYIVDRSFVKRLQKSQMCEVTDETRSYYTYVKFYSVRLYLGIHMYYTVNLADYKNISAEEIGREHTIDDEVSRHHVSSENLRDLLLNREVTSLEFNNFEWGIPGLITFKVNNQVFSIGREQEKFDKILDWYGVVKYTNLDNLSEFCKINKKRFVHSIEKKENKFNAKILYYLTKKKEVWINISGEINNGKFDKIKYQLS